MLPLFPLCLKDSLHTEAMAASVCLLLLCATWACGFTHLSPVCLLQSAGFNSLGWAWTV